MDLSALHLQGHFPNFGLGEGMEYAGTDHALTVSLIIVVIEIVRSKPNAMKYP